MKKKYRLLMCCLAVLALLTCKLASAETCKVISIDKMDEGIYEITLDPVPFLDPGFTGEWIFLEGPQAYQGIERPIEQRGNVVVATLNGRKAGDKIQFSFGRGVGMWAIPGCPEEELDGHFVAIIPADTVSAKNSFPLAPITGLLLNKNP